MYKYTSLLSDSYRQTVNSSLQQRHKYRKQNETTYIKQRISSNCSCSQHSHNKTKGYDFKSQNQNSSTAHNQHFNNIHEKSKRRSISSTYDPQTSLLDRIQRLSDLSDRHQQALREVQLQAKLKEITNKYARKDSLQQTPYFHSKKQFDTNKKVIENSSKHRQNYSNLQMKNSYKERSTVTVYQPKFDRNQYNRRKQQQSKLINQTTKAQVHGQTQRTGEDREVAVSKLTSLQERIKLSIDKHH